MPMSRDFQERLFPILPEIIREFGTPFIIHDATGIEKTIKNMYAQFRDIQRAYGFKQYFAVKASPVPAILEIMQRFGCGLDCSSIPELVMGRQVGFLGEDIMFSSNNTAIKEFKAALADGGCILNLDDITMIPKVPEFPKLICIRYNPGKRRSGNEIIGNPVESKYGVRRDQIVEAYRQARQRGAERFGLHTMICSNELNHDYFVETVLMLLEIVELVSKELGIKFEFINIGGGIGIDQRPNEEPFNISALAKKAKVIMDQFREKYGYAPKLLTECGRYIVGPHGVLVTTVINRMSKYREYVGVDASMVDFMRPGIYGEKAFHPIIVLDSQGNPKRGPIEIVDVIGSMCENNDKFAIQRPLPRVVEGDLIVLQCAGAHGRAMGSNYNGRLRCQELLYFRETREIEMVRRPETIDDYFATFKNLKRRIIKPKGKEV